MDNDKNTDGELPEPVRDHLGQQLRAMYSVSAEKPQFLGDEVAVPEAFAPQIKRLETRISAHEGGKEAVEQALDKILDAFGVAPEDDAGTSGKAP